MAAERDAAGLAALSICESLMLALVERGVLRLEEAHAALEDAAAAHQNRDANGEDPNLHRLALQIVERLMIQVNAAHPASAHVGVGQMADGGSQD
ncbi:hypothetical protein FHW79_003051 [Azospirillum sp. OGB3]|uniref:hypothetical protein n=1 Tax=Azospirillum sp. OGB3 TaxID=2587012 RepID=UPI0016069A61|nr:hypothetical protein [Azospirillum sp. OGB3]MBB3265431.1 hypothetical protein [Azospirillum sp. OGB3]